MPEEVLPVIIPSEPAGEQQRNSKEERIARLLPYQYKKGQSGNPTGRAGKGESLKEYAKRRLAMMSDEEKEEYLEGISKDTIWEMAESKPKQDVEANITHNMAGVLDLLEHDEPISGQEALGQAVADVPSLQDPQQATEPSPVQAEPSAEPLQPTQMVSQLNSEVETTGLHD